MEPTEKPVTEACQPYTYVRAVPPVNIWAVIDRLTPAEMRGMVMAFAVHDPRWFEDKLQRTWAAR